MMGHTMRKLLSGGSTRPCFETTVARKRKQILDKLFTQSAVTEPWPTGDW